MARLSARATLTEEERLRRDYNLMTRLAILHKPQTDNWPSNVSNTFRNVDKLGSIRFRSYEEMTPLPYSHTMWRLSTKSRAQELSDMAQRLLNENPSELTWRLELEKLVDARFRMKTEWLWRSEIEVTAECYGPISNDLEMRRLRRTVCQCLVSTYSGLNPLFSNRADQCFQYDSHLSEILEDERLPERRPDRVYGLQETSNFREKLEKYYQFRDDCMDHSLTVAMDDIDSESDRVLVRNLIQSSPFNRRGSPLLFPFLIMEAKSETGQGFVTSGIQTSLSIWALLKGQEKMIEHSASLNEQGGPFLWYIAYLGDAWRVSGCCISTEGHRPTYQIIDLWNGRISSPDGAIQLLLIVDYVFDWARDLYRPAVLRLLDIMSSSDLESASLAEDSDIFSSRRDPQLDDISENESTSDLDELSVLVEIKNLSCWRKFDLEDNSRRNLLRGRVVCRGFRPANIVKSEFHCLYINGDNMRTLVASLGGNSYQFMKMARDVLSALRMGPMISTENILSYIEDSWTGTPRPSRYGGSAKKIVCSIACAASVSTNWELRSTITCVAVDIDALNDIRGAAALKRRSLRLDNIEEIAETLSERSAADVLQQRRLRNGTDDLYSVLTKLIEFWTLTKIPSDNRGSRLADPSTAKVIMFPRSGEIYRAYKVVFDTYNRHKQPGLLEPDYPYIRFSARVNQLECREIADSQVPPRADGPSWAHDIFSREPILLCDSNGPRTHLCLYIKNPTDPPQGRELVSELARTIASRKFFILNRSPLGRSLRYFGLGHLSRAYPEERLMPIICNSAKAWLRDLLKSFDNMNEVYEHIEISDDDDEDISHSRAKPFSDTRSHENNHDRHIENARETRSAPTGPQYGEGFQPGEGFESGEGFQYPEGFQYGGGPQYGGGSQYGGGPQYGAFASGTSPLPTDEDLLLYTNRMEISTILEQADGDGLTDNQISVLIQLGYFK